MYIVKIFGVYVATLKMGHNGFYATGRTFGEAIDNVCSRATAQ